MFTGGMSPFSYTAYPAGGFLQNSGLKPLAQPGSNDLFLKPAVNSPFGESNSFNADSFSNPDWFGMFKTMMTPMLEQFGLKVPGLNSDEASDEPGAGNGDADDEDDDAAKKWKATLKSAARVQDNVEAVKVSPPDDSGYYSSLSCYSGS